MIISFTGAQSTGKSTLFNECKKDGRFNDFNYEPEITRYVKKKYNLAINEGGDDITQLAILNRHMYNYLEYKDKDVLLDRCIVDGLVYTSYQYLTNRVSEEVSEYATFLFEKLIDKLDIIFYTEPEIPLVDDGERSVNKEFRDKIVELFEEAIKHFNIPVVRLSGTKEERMTTIYKTIDNLKYGK
jgi:nicotinamide riboside kinase